MATTAMSLLIGQTPAEMQQAQQSMLAWARQRQRTAEYRVKALTKNIDAAKAAGLKVRPMQAQRRREVKRLYAYEKIADAINAGYYLVPNFPIDLFAVRKGAAKPKTGRTTRYQDAGEFSQQPDQLRLGEGRYVNVLPFITSITDHSGDEPKKMWYPISFDEQISPPAAIVSAGLLPQLVKAMKRKVFDAIGMVGPIRQRDPMLVGQIIIHNNGYSRREMTFLIAWWMQMEDF